MPTRLVLVPRLLLSVGLALVLLTSRTFLHGGASTREALGALTLVVCVAVLLVETEHGRAVLELGPVVSRTALAVLAACGVVACWLLPNGSGVAVPLVVARLASQRSLPRWARVTLLVVAAVPLVASTLLAGGPWWAVIGWPLAVGVVFESGLRVQSRRQQLEDAELLLAQEQALREEHVRSAAAAERTRIARELHDVLAHTLSGLTVTLQATAVLLEAENASAAARAQVDRARALAVDGLAEARTAVASLAAAGDDRSRVDLVAVLGRQVREHRTTTGTGATLDVVDASPDRLADLSPALVAAASGILREALTNAVRHAPGSPVHVTVGTGSDRVSLVVEVDEGRPAEPARPGGMGLGGMRQRAGEVGGELSAGPSAQGWRVTAALPLEQPAVGRG